MFLGSISPEQNPDASTANVQVAAQLSKATGLAIKPKDYVTYQQAMDDMGKNLVHILWMPPGTYLFASERGIAEVALLANHFGIYQYGTQYLANTISGFTIYFDPISGLNNVDAPTALEQFRGKRPCWVDPSSLSGYIVPSGILAQNKITPGDAVYTQSHTSVVRSLYVKGVCDFGATFSVSGDPRTGSAVLTDLPDALERIPVIWRSDAIIPNLNIAYIAGLDEAKSKTLTAAFLEIAKTPEGRALLSSAANNYQVDALKAVEDPIYDPLRSIVKILKINLKDLLGK